MTICTTSLRRYAAELADLSERVMSEYGRDEVGSVLYDAAEKASEAAALINRRLSAAEDEAGDRALRQRNRDAAWHNGRTI